VSADPFDLEGQARIQQEREERDRLAEQSEVADWVWLMQSKRGRRIVNRLLARAGVFQLSFNTNAMTMAFNEGRRNEGLAITATLMTHCPAQYTQMLEEHSNV
jgi:hypothetical protein